jgi:branched-chain amino acid transport system ATP-binding protein
VSGPALALDRLSIHFGGLRAVEDVSLAVPEGQIFSIIGPNGAGKTTIFNAISGLYAPTSGEILVGGRRVTRLAPHARARLGVSRTFQNIRLFRELTVRENIRVARYCRTRAGVVASLVRTPAMRRERHQTDATVDALLGRLGLAGRAEELARNLPYGEQKRLELARALASEPRLLLLDEPAAGTSAAEATELMALIRGLRDQGLTILLVEHHIRVVMQVSDRIAVLNHGELIAEGSPEAVRRDPAVIAAYLGEET